MVDLVDTWNKVIEGLNSIDELYLFVRANTIHNLPKYPFGTVNILSNIKADTSKRGIVNYISKKNGLVKQRLEQPKIVFSINLYSDKQDVVLQMVKKVQDWLYGEGEQYFENNGIIFLESTQIQDRTSFLELEYQYKIGFDITVRVLDILETNISPAKSVQINNTNINLKKEE